MRLFLITQDGVREISAELDFERAEFNGQERNNFRFDAVSSVHVIQTGDFEYTLGLTLTNGPTRKIRVTDPEGYQPDPSESPDAFSKINLDAAGFAHTLHILEGIAAEGKGWIKPATPHQQKFRRPYTSDRRHVETNPMNSVSGSGGGDANADRVVAYGRPIEKSK
jgi:hypothetical protein